jgi:hypothetical protein
MQGIGGLFQSHVSEERVDGPQPGVPRASAVFAGAFQVIEEKTDGGGIEVFDPKLGRAFVESFLGKLQKQAERIAISRYGVRTCLPLAKQVVGEEGLKKRRKAGGNHGRTSLGISRSVTS